MFSAHDYNLIDILSNLFSVDFLKEKIFDSLDNQADFTFLFPPLASSILIELIEVKGEKSKFVRIIYNGVEINRGLSSQVDTDVKSGLLNFDQFQSLLLSRIDNSYKSLDCRKLK